MRRRAFIAAAAVTAAAPKVAFAAREPRGEVAILHDALELEQLAVYVYDAAVKSGLLDAQLLATVGALRDHEQQHAEAIGASLEALGGALPAKPNTPEDADAILTRRGATGRLRAATSRENLFELAHEVEMLQVHAYVQAAGDVGDVRLMQTCASIAAAEGAHLVVLRGLLDREPVPAALESDPG